MHVGIVGAGAVGGYLAVALSSAGQRVTLLGRRRLDDPSAMRIVRLDGSELRPGDALAATHELEALADADIVLVTVKAQDTAESAEPLGRVLGAGAPVVSFQNGLRNLERLRARLPGPVVGGVVSFNVVSENGSRRETTRGKFLLGRAEGAAGQRVEQLAAALSRVGVRCELRQDIEQTIAGKLLINLGNGVAAATGMPTAAMLASRDARWCLSRCMREGMAAMRGAGLRPATVTVLPPMWMARSLLLPDAIVAPLAKAIASVDPAARASTLQDLDRGVPTEIDELNGAIVWLAEKSGGDAPVNRLVTNLVHEHERAASAGARPDFVAPPDLRRRIEALV